jgi:hypothetical protein
MTAYRSILFLSFLVAMTGFALFLQMSVMAEAVNPDPNHTHADVAIWIDGSRLDLSASQYMSDSSTEADQMGALHSYLHLHNGIGNVIHRHKPGLPLGEFINSLPQMQYDGSALQYQMPGSANGELETSPVRLFVNGSERTEGSAYVFEDTDAILLTNATDDRVVRRQLRAVSDDACLYSKTCPWRGDPPAEDCVADPTVPCVGI